MVNKSGLRKWFAEDWRDIKTGKKCGRSGKEKGSRPYPACRPAKVAKRMTAAQKRTAAAQKTGPAPIKYAITASGRKRKKKNNG
tara:strand:+ start:1311 stop:1562 length:252 start_codon:yes stop_codon:yes gene_type:complete